MSWRDFCDAHRIQYRRGSGDTNIQVYCPFCGPEDTSMHLGLHLNSPSWGCWENKSHKGRSPIRLIIKLLRCSEEEALAYARQYFYWRGQISQVKAERKWLPPPELADEFMQFKAYSTHEINQMQLQFQNYLRKRNLDPDWVSDRYKLLWCTKASSPWRDRIVVPVYESKELKTWTARSISASQKLRYRALEERPPGEYLLDIDNLNGGEVLIVCEGPFDAMAIASCFVPGVGATCLFGKRYSDRQQRLVAERSEDYGMVINALDRKEYASSLRETLALEAFVPNVKAWQPENKDFGTSGKVELKREIQRMLVNVK